MKTLKHVLLLFVVLSIVTLPTSSTAASTFDHVVQPAVSLEFKIDPSYYTAATCSRIDLSASYSSYITNPVHYNGTTYNDPDETEETLASAFSDYLESSVGSLHVTQRWDADIDGAKVWYTYISFSSQPMTVEWLSPSYARLTGSSIRSVALTYDPGSMYPGCDIFTVDHGVSSYQHAATSSSVRPFVSYGVDFDYPSGYEGIGFPTTPPVPSYIALGDSFSSGEGNPSFEFGTDQGGVNPNGCHRSPFAYPRLLQGDSNLDLGSTAFVACSGATTANITGGQFNEPAQVDALSDGTEVVTITIGGNDVGFSDYVIGCAFACGPSTGPLLYNAIMSNIAAPAFKANLITTYEEILEEAPNAEVYVADYPYISTPGQTSCYGFDFSGARGVQVALNGVIADAVATVRLSNTSIHYIDTNASGSPFDGKHLCNGLVDSAFNGPVLPPDTEYSFHPNQDGHIAYKEVIADAIS